MSNKDKWKDIISKLDYAFQPIVNVHTGVCFGYEALLRNYKKLGFNCIYDIFDEAYQDQMLYKIDLWLRKKAIKSFVKIKYHEKTKLFLNLDNRVVEMPDYTPGNTSKILDKYNLSANALCFEISERHEFKSYVQTKSILGLYKQQEYKIAIDDFGTGFSGLQLFYYSEPDFVKIDQFFINNIARDVKKRLFVMNIISLAHALGIAIIAEGIETEEEFYACKEMNCDLIQGYLIQKPTSNLSHLRFEYKIVNLLNKKNKRRENLDQELLYKQVEYINPVVINAAMLTVFDSFRKSNRNTYLPVVNESNEPLGIIRENDLKKYAYSAYGKELVRNKNSTEFVTKCPIVEINTKVEEILEIFSVAEDSEGIIMSENGKYIGFLNARSLLNVLNEKNIRIAQDQNPLTKLAGNTVINEYISKVLGDQYKNFILVYFDFDHFKPFNDKYGFRVGDRAILLFADILKQASHLNGLIKGPVGNGVGYMGDDRCFIGHVGGDDFFTGFESKDDDFADIYKKIRDIIEQFACNIASYYDVEDRKRGYIESLDRDGNSKLFPLLTVSAAVLHIPAQHALPSTEELSLIIATLKKRAKASTEKIGLASLTKKTNWTENLIYHGDFFESNDLLTFSQ